VVSLDLAVADATQKDAGFSVSDLDLVTEGERTAIRARVQNRGASAASGASLAERTVKKRRRTTT